jgi:hypothetical protein
VFIALFLVLFVREAYARGWWWTGLVPFPSDKEKDTKTLWEWLKLLFVPAVLAAGGYLFTQQQQQQADRTNAAQHQSDLKIADDQAKNTVLYDYMNTMSDLLLKEGLLNSKPGSPVQEIAQARTITAVRRLDGPRNGILLTFASRSGVDLGGTDLSGANLEGASIAGVKLPGINLSGADLSGAVGKTNAQVESETPYLKGTILPSGKKHE